MPIHRKLRASYYLAATVVLLAAGTGNVSAIGPYDSRNGDECRAQVNANYDAMEAAMHANGNDTSIPVVEARFRMPALAECRRMDELLRYERLAPSLDRLSSALEGLRSGRANSTAAMQAINADHTTILQMPPSPYRAEYLRQYADYQRYLSLVPPPAPAPFDGIYRCSHPSAGVSYGDQPCAPVSSEESCDSLRKHADNSRRAYDQAVNALLSSANQTGNGWRSSEDHRQKALSDLRWYSDRARLQGCPTS